MRLVLVVPANQTASFDALSVNVFRPPVLAKAARLDIVLVAVLLGLPARALALIGLASSPVF